MNHHYLFSPQGHRRFHVFDGSAGIIVKTFPGLSLLTIKYYIGESKLVASDWNTRVRTPAFGLSLPVTRLRTFTPIAPTVIQTQQDGTKTMIVTSSNIVMRIKTHDPVQREQISVKFVLDGKLIKPPSTKDILVNNEDFDWDGVRHNVLDRVSGTLLAFPALGMTVV